MPYYLRFLKNPTLDYGLSHSATKSKKTRTSHTPQRQGLPKLQLTFTCQTDLGDLYYDGNVLIIVRLICSEPSRTQIACGEIGWAKGDRVRSESITLNWQQKLNLTQKPWIWLEVDSNKSKSLASDTASLRGDALSVEKMPEIISVLAPLSNGNEGCEQQGLVSLERRVQRQFLLHTWISKCTMVSIYEEMGESIARHIWDAALGLLAACIEVRGFENNLGIESEQKYQIPQLLTPYFNVSARKAKRHLGILELGSGCGIVGLSLARLVPDSQFILTDLPEALEILDENVLQMTKLGLAPGTSVVTRVLDWNWFLENMATIAATDGDSSQSLAGLRPDLVIVSDCTYNSSSFQALVATLLHLVRQGHEHNPHEEHMKLDVLVSYKFRHESESQFFDGMLGAGFHILSQSKVKFPDQTREPVGLEPENAEIFAFAWQGLGDRR